MEDAVGRLEHYCELRVGHEAGGKERRQRAVDDGDLLASEEEVPPGSPARASSIMTAIPAFMSLAPRPCTAPSAIRPGMFPCAGIVSRWPARSDRPAIAVEQHLAVVVERRPGHELADEGDEPGLGAALGGHVDELERSGCEIGSRHDSRHNDLQMAVRQPDPTPGPEPERGFVLAVLAQGVDPDGELAELEELARTAGVEPVARLVQHRQHPDPRTYVGKGKLDELKQSYGDAKRGGADRRRRALAVAAAPARERAPSPRVVDRAELILDIFAQHAVTRRGKAAGRARPARVQPAAHARHVAAPRALGGGLGTRGPGESQLETDRRLARRRVSLLKDRLKELGRQRDVRRKERRRTQMPTVALAGYTNVGKSTLLNALTDATVSVRDRLFETLDPTTRGFEHDGRRYLVTDTVGFVRRLPHQLVEGFAATLEETLVADLILHVVDGSVSEDTLIEQIAAVNAVLHEIGADELPIELVINKIDAVDAEQRRRLSNRYADAVQVSAVTGEGLDDLRTRIADRFAERFESVRLLLPYEDGAKLNELVRARRAHRAARGQK